MPVFSEMTIWCWIPNWCVLPWIRQLLLLPLLPDASGFPTASPLYLGWLDSGTVSWVSTISASTHFVLELSLALFWLHCFDRSTCESFGLFAQFYKKITNVASSVSGMQDTAQTVWPELNDKDWWVCFVCSCPLPIFSCSTALSM